MSQQSFAEIFVSDPLSKVTRSERRVLLGVSALGIAIVKTGLVPSKIAALGIEFEQADKRALLIIMGVVILYFLIAFALYATSDYFAWRYRYSESLHAYRTNDESAAERAMTGTRKPMPIVVLRLLFEFILPVAVGICSIALLWTAQI
jgi:heme/copper-type cytochrome/quinol oxidase subunit 2